MSQSEAILKDLRRGWTVTALDALDRYFCLRLAPRILDLRRQGWPIERVWIQKSGKRYASYRLRPASPRGNRGGLRA